MGKINWVRVFLGGLLAGLIINVGEVAFHWVIRGADWWFFKALSQPVQHTTAIVHYIGVRLLVGIAAIWLYAAARPRFGPGPRTALIAAFGYWVIGDALPTLSYAPLLATHPWLQPFSARGWVIGSLAGLAEIALATIVGAWSYRE